MTNDGFIELTSTDGQTLIVRKSQVNAFEVVPASQRVDGHVKVYVGGFKFLIQIDKDELMRLLTT
jgi:hypothetical protein